MSEDEPEDEAPETEPKPEEPASAAVKIGAKAGPIAAHLFNPKPGEIRGGRS